MGWSNQEDLVHLVREQINVPGIFFSLRRQLQELELDSKSVDPFTAGAPVYTIVKDRLGFVSQARLGRERASDSEVMLTLVW